MIQGKAQKTCIWNSRIGWRIALSAFTAILVIQAGQLWLLFDVMDITSLDKQALQEWWVIFSLACALIVTILIMVMLKIWLLKPLFYIRSRLMYAAQSDDEKNKNNLEPIADEYEYDIMDEVGEVLAAADHLIAQNSNTLQRLHSFAETQIHKLAYFDTLTDLPNRVYFVEKLKEQSKMVAKDANHRFAVVALDLDHFKDVNDSMGHKVGDMILRNIAKRLQANLPESALVARSGEDEFVVALPLKQTDNPAQIAEEIGEAVKGEPYALFNESFEVGASVGYATFPDDDDDADLVLKHAMTALNRAKEDGRGVIRGYTKDFEAAVQQRLQVLRDLRIALDNNDLELYYQPQFDLESGDLIGAEALLRWYDKNSDQFISPGIFVPIAESSGLVVQMGEWVINHAIAQNAAWQSAGLKPIRVAVNVSASQFLSADLPDFIDKELKAQKLEPKYLEVELTESAFVQDIDRTIRVLQRLHEMDIEIAIDDFGTGYSSLSYLRQFPIDRLKIDQSFIKNAPTNQDDAVITRTIIALAKSLNLRVIAEGVETVEHETLLKAEGCQEVQGYYYGRPMPADEFEKQFLKKK